MKAILWNCIKKVFVSLRKLALLLFLPLIIYYIFIANIFRVRIQMRILAQYYELLIKLHTAMGKFVVLWFLKNRSVTFTYVHIELNDFTDNFSLKNGKTSLWENILVFVFVMTYVRENVKGITYKVYTSFPSSENTEST